MMALCTITGLCFLAIAACTRPGVETLGQGKIPPELWSIAIHGQGSPEGAHQSLARKARRRPLIDLVWQAGLGHSAQSGRWWPVPRLRPCQCFPRPCRNRHLNSKPKDSSKIANQVDDFEDLAFQLFGRAQSMWASSWVNCRTRKGRAARRFSCLCTTPSSK